MKPTSIISQELNEKLKEAQRAVADARESGVLDELAAPVDLNDVDGEMEKILAEPHIGKRVK